MSDDLGCKMPKAFVWKDENTKTLSFKVIGVKIIEFLAPKVQTVAHANNFFALFCIVFCLCIGTESHSSHCYRVSESHSHRVSQ